MKLHNFVALNSSKSDLEDRIGTRNEKKLNYGCQNARCHANLTLKTPLMLMQNATKP